jgi:hypothetical protein
MWTACSVFWRPPNFRLRPLTSDFTSSLPGFKFNPLD